MQYLTVNSSLCISSDTNQLKRKIKHSPSSSCCSLSLILSSYILQSISTDNSFSNCSLRGRWYTLHATPPLLTVSTPFPPLRGPHPLALHPAHVSLTAEAGHHPLLAPTLSWNNHDMDTTPPLGTVLMRAFHHHPVLFWSGGTSSLMRSSPPKTWH